MSDHPDVTPNADDELDELIHRADLDGLVRLVDARTTSRDWPGLLRARDRARHALRTGRQVWPIATLAEYRLALWAPAEWASRVLDEDSGRFTIGPLTEVVAQHHTFVELADHLPPGPRAGFVAHERAARGEAIPAATPNPLELPFDRQWWEPPSPLVTYTDDGADAPSPPLPTASAFAPRPRQGSRRRAAVADPAAAAAAAAAATVDDASVTLAVRQLFDPWTTSSDGHVEVVCVEGDAVAAVTALGVPSARLAPMSGQDALAWLMWAGASGGAHGRRRGAAIGRFGTWWLLAALGDLLDEWPVPPTDLASLVGDLVWWWWDAGEPSLGWEVQLAVEDRGEGYAWAISAHDSI